MRGTGSIVRGVVCGTALLIASGCTPSSTKAPEIGSEPGWSALPDFSMADVKRSGVYWAGDRLVVAGGERLEFVSEPVQQKGYPTAESQAFDPETGQWHDLGSLPSAGYDGVTPFAGAWTGTELIVLGDACNDYSELALPECSRVAVTWSPSAGWQDVELPPADLMTGVPTTLPSTAPGTAVFYTPGGLLTWDSNDGSGDHWSFEPHRILSDGSRVGFSCYADDRIFLAASTYPWVDTGTTTFASVALDGEDEVIYGSYPALTKSGGPLCLPDAVLYQPDLDKPIVRLGLDGVITSFGPITTPVPGQAGGAPVSLVGAVVLGDHWFTGSHYLDSFGKGATMPDLPEIYDGTPADDRYYAAVADSSGKSKWFVLNFADPSNATFPPVR